MERPGTRELIGTEGMVILDTFRRLNRRGAVAHLLKLVDKTHPADVAWAGNTRQYNGVTFIQVQPVAAKPSGAGVPHRFCP